MELKTALTRTFSRHGLNLLLITILSAVTCWIYWAPNLTGDDWLYLNLAVTGQIRWLDLSIARPLEGTYSKLIYFLGGVNIPFYYVSNFLIWLLICLAFYFLLARLFQTYKPLPVVASLIFSIYPIYQLRMWLTASHPNLALLFTIIFAGLLYEYKRRAAWPWLAAALAALVVSLMDYEGQLGLVIAWSLLLAIFGVKSWRARIGLSSPVLVTVLYVGWRVLRSGGAGSPFDTASTYWVSARQVLADPLLLPERLFAGIKNIFLGWIAPWTTVDSQSPFFWQALLVILFLFLAAVSILWWNYIKLPGKPASGADPDRKIVYKIILVSGALAIVGYIPIILIYDPGLDYFNSRVNLFAIPGASVLVATAITALASLAKNIQRRWMNMSLLLIFFIASGSIFQIEVQYESRRVWCEQANVWAQLMKVAPDVTNGSFIGIVFQRSHYGENIITRDAIISPWEVDSAVRLLYDDQTLSGGVFYLNRPDISSFDSNGIKLSWPPRTESYSEAVLFQYDESTRQLATVNNLNKIGMAERSNYIPARHILPSTSDESPYLPLINQCAY